MRRIFNLVIGSILLSASVASANEYTEGKMVAKETSLTDMYYLAPKDEVKTASNVAKNNKAEDMRAVNVGKAEMKEAGFEKNMKSRQIRNNETESDEKSEASYPMEGFQIGGGIGVLGGVNASVGYRIPRRDSNFWKNRFGFRLDYNTWRPLKKSIDKYFDEHPIKVDDEPIETAIKGHNFGALIDFYPFGNTWGLGNLRLSGGYYTGDFELSGLLHRRAVATDDITFDVGDKIYSIDKGSTANVYLDAKLRADIQGPYAGLGFDLALFAGLKFFFDAGVVFLDNKPEILTDVWGNGTIHVASVKGMTIEDEGTIDLSGLDEASKKKLEKMKSDFRAEYEDELEELTKKYFPMVKFGFLYRF